MEPRDTYDPLDELITETLRNRMGPAPSKKVWAGITRELVRQQPRYPRLREWLSLLYVPVSQSALIVAMLVLVLLQPAYYWMNQEAPIQPQTYDLVVPMRPRPLPEGEQIPDVPPTEALEAEERDEPDEVIIAPAQMSRSIEAQ
jgi:hypothetical protein